MDMKRILQAMDSVATKPVAGVNDMAKFLRTVKEADINQPATEAPPAMPDITGMKPGVAKDMGDGSKITVNKDGTVSYQGGWGTYVYNSQGQHIKTQSPSFAGYSQETDPTGKVTQQNYSQGPMDLQKGPEGTKASYDLGVGVANMQQAPGQAPTGSMNMRTDAVQENTMDKFLSIVKSNDVGILNEGANPHKVALPVQMAMQHYQTPKKKTVKEPSIINRYFAEAEEAIQERAEEKKQLMRQYASVIAERVMMRESKDKSEAIAKRRALQDLSDENTYTKKNFKNSINRPKLSLGATEEKLDERSVSQAQARTMAAAAHNPEFAKKVGISKSVATEFNKADTGKKLKTLPKRVKKGKAVNEHEAGWERRGMAGVGLQSNQAVEEAPIAMDPAQPNNPTIHGHEKANPMTLKGRIQQTRNQLRELAQLAESDELVVWERITKLAKGGMFMGLEQNLEQIRHGIAELAAKRKRGGSASKGIDKNISESATRKEK